MDISKSVLTQVNLFDSVILLLYLLGIVYISKKYLNISVNFFYLFITIGLLHFAFTFLYLNYTLSNVSDSVGYFRRALYIFENWSDTFGQGSYFIYFILYPLIHYLELNYFGLFFLFSFLGLIGFHFLFKITITGNNYKWTRFYFILLLPNVHFWTVAIGKDSLMFFAICWLSYSYYYRLKFYNLLIPLLLIGFLRIHILVFIFLSFAITLTFLNKKIGIVNKLLWVFVILGSIYASSTLILNRVGIQDIQEFGNRIEELQFVNQGGGSSVDMSDRSILVKWLSFLFRPLFFDAHNLLSVFISFENLIWIGILLKIFLNFRNKIIIERIRFFYWVMIISFIGISIPLSYILTNLGIAIRQKVIVFPFMFLSLLIVNSNLKLVKSIKKYE